LIDVDQAEEDDRNFVAEILGEPLPSEAPQEDDVVTRRKGAPKSKLQQYILFKRCRFG